MTGRCTRRARCDGVAMAGDNGFTLFLLPAAVEQTIPASQDEGKPRQEEGRCR